MNTTWCVLCFASSKAGLQLTLFTLGSMEYAICQTERKNPLILSEYCGISTSLNSAVRINPWDLTDCARQIDYCLGMSEDEKAARHADMYRRVTTHTAAVWQAELTLMLLEARLKEEATHHTPDVDDAVVLEAFVNAKKRVLFFDYDGTLTPIVRTPEAAVPSKECLDSLMTLSSDPRNVLYIVSGRDRGFLMKHMGHIPNLGFSAEHGCFLKKPGAKEWINLTDGVDMSWRADVEDIFRCMISTFKSFFFMNCRSRNLYRLRGANHRCHCREESRIHYVPPP